LMTPGRATSCSAEELILNPSRGTPSTLRGVVPEIEI
jgi:hypothetical protein